MLKGNLSQLIENKKDLKNISKAQMLLDEIQKAAIKSDTKTILKNYNLVSRILSDLEITIKNK